MIKVKAVKRIGSDDIEVVFTAEDIKHLKVQLVKSVFDYYMTLTKSRTDAVTWTAETLNYSERWVWKCVR